VSHGLEIWNAAGVKTVSYSSDLVREVGSGTLAGTISSAQNFTINVSGIENNGRWAVILSAINYPSYGYWVDSINSGSFVVRIVPAYSTPYEIRWVVFRR
jgi:hypothetical protein